MTWVSQFDICLGFATPLVEVATVLPAPHSFLPRHVSGMGIRKSAHSFFHMACDSHQMRAGVLCSAYRERMALLATGQVKEIATDTVDNAGRTTDSLSWRRDIQPKSQPWSKDWRQSKARSSLAGSKQVQATVELCHTRKLADPGSEGCVGPEESIRKKTLWLGAGDLDT